MHNNDELLDLVDKDDSIIGTIWRSQSDKLLTDNLGYIRAVDMFLQNENGEIWVPKRTAHKKLAPNGLDYSAGGHVSSGETYNEAMLKEISEELNLNVGEADIEILGKMGPESNGYIRTIYRLKSNEAPDYNPDDFVNAEWMTVDALMAILRSGAIAKESILPTLEQFYSELTSQ